MRLCKNVSMEQDADRLPFFLAAPAAAEHLYRAAFVSIHY